MIAMASKHSKDMRNHLPSRKKRLIKQILHRCELCGVEYDDIDMYAIHHIKRVENADGSDQYTKKASSLIFPMENEEVVAVSYRTGGIMVSTTYVPEVRKAVPGDQALQELSGNLYITRDVDVTE